MNVEAEWAGHYEDVQANSDKIWAACYTDTGDFIATWGRRGSTYSSQVKHFGSQYEAQRHYGKMTQEKAGKGYHTVRFEDARSGSIPHFRVQSASGDYKITPQSILDRIKALIARIKRSYEPDVQLVEYQQLKATSELFINYAAEKAGVAELEPALQTLQVTIKAALLA
jgi:predicted DNA-binding WGR domain protein